MAIPTLEVLVHFVSIIPGRQKKTECAVVIVLLLTNIILVGTVFCDVVNNFHNIQNFLKSISYLCFDIETASVLLCFIYYETPLLEMVNIMSGYYREISRSHPYRVQPVNTIYKWLTFLTVSQCIVVFSPPIVKIMLDGKIDYSMLPVDMYMPWDVNSIFRYIAAYIYQSYVVLTMYIVRHFAALLNLIFAQWLRDNLYDIRSQLMTSKSAGAALEHTHSLQIDQFNTELTANCNAQYEILHSKNILKAIRDYHQLHKVYSLFKPLFESCYSLCLARFIATNCITIYVMNKEGGLKHAAVILGMCVYNVQVLFLHSYVGELVYTVNSALQFSYFSIPWYNIPSEDRSMILTMMHMLQKPIMFKGFQTYIASFRIFGECIQTSYSYFNVLRKVF